MLVRKQGKAYAFFDQCPHRGVPLSIGQQEFPGTWTCRYHGWTFNLETGVLEAALTDGPDSPICGKVRVKTYHVEERAGLIWLYIGESDPSPLEADIPAEFLESDVVILGRITIQKGNWRYACENGIDEGHAKYLHRYGVVRSFFRELPAWSKIKLVMDKDGWIIRETEKISFGDNYGELGRWPRKNPFWKRRGKGHRISMRLPCILRNEHLNKRKVNVSWYVPVDHERYRYLQFYATRARGVSALWFRLCFWLYYRWAHLIQFNNQDIWMVSLMPETPPERLYRPDVSITAWRKLCEHARGDASGLSMSEEESTLISEQSVGEISRDDV
jgi:phenylpropionate dioxygenase-like ring-hydroxylating dioxygenase large terminal subunit